MTTSIEFAYVDPASIEALPALSADVAKRHGISENLARLRKTDPTANVCMIRQAGGGSTPYRLVDAMPPSVPVEKAAENAADLPPGELTATVSKAAHEHNANVMKGRRDAFTAYVTKVATERKVTVAQANEDLANARDPEYTQLWKRVSEALHAPSQQLASGLGGPLATYAAFDAQKSARAQAEAMKQANAEAQKMARMTTSEVELYKRASALATAKKIDIQAAQGELLETSSEARALYKRIPFEKSNR